MSDTPDLEFVALQEALLGHYSLEREIGRGGMAADRLYEELPKDVRNSFKELPDVVRRLEQDAERMRARIKELDGVLSSIESDEAMGRSGTAAGAPGVSGKRESLTADLTSALELSEDIERVIEGGARWRNCWGAVRVGDDGQGKKWDIIAKHDNCVSYRWDMIRSAVESSRPGLR